MPTPASCRMSSQRLQRPTRTNSRFRMLPVQLHVARPPGFEEMRRRAFKTFTPLLQQPLPACSHTVPVASTHRGGTAALWCQLRRQRFGSEMDVRAPRGLSATVVWLL